MSKTISKFFAKASKANDCLRSYTGAVRFFDLNGSHYFTHTNGFYAVCLVMLHDGPIVISDDRRDTFISVGGQVNGDYPDINAAIGYDLCFDVPTADDHSFDKGRDIFISLENVKITKHTHIDIDTLAVVHSQKEITETGNWFRADWIMDAVDMLDGRSVFLAYHGAVGDKDGCHKFTVRGMKGEYINLAMRSVN
jgi:hypothetical protein